MIYVPISLGELFDKVTILKIKINKITETEKLKNVMHEYNFLSDILKKNNFSEENRLFKELYKLNLEFWNYHDWQREKWKELMNADNIIDIELYKRSKYEHIFNDRRAEIKKKINIQYNSNIIEEKQFTSYNI